MAALIITKKNPPIDFLDGDKNEITEHASTPNRGVIKIR